MPAKIVLKKERSGNFRFRVLGATGKTLATSENYANKATATRAIESLRKAVPGAQVDDQSVAKTAAPARTVRSASAAKRAPAAKKSAAKTATAKRTTAKKTAATSERTTAKRTTAKTATARKSAAKTAPATKKSSPSKTSTSRSTATKTTAKRTTKSAPATKKASATAGRKTAAKTARSPRAAKKANGSGPDQVSPAAPPMPVAEGFPDSGAGAPQEQSGEFSSTGLDYSDSTSTDNSTGSAAEPGAAEPGYVAEAGFDDQSGFVGGGYADALPEGSVDDAAVGDNPAEAEVEGTPT